MRIKQQQQQLPKSQNIRHPTTKITTTSPVQTEA
jgi:hypothetical protein